MICILSFVVFSILSIFSASYRDLAKEAFECVWKRVTLRPCDTGFQQKVKSRITASIMKRSPRIAKFVHKYSEILAFTLIALLLASFLYSAYGIVNFYLYGSCNGNNNSQFCVLDPNNKHNQVSAVGGASCSADQTISPNSLLSTPLKSLILPTKGTGSNTVYFVGSFTCKYTRAAYPLMKKLFTENEEKVTFSFAHFPIDETSQKLHTYNYCARQQNNSEAYWKWVDGVFTTDVEQLQSPDTILNLLKTAGFSESELNSCLNSPETTQKLIIETQSLTKTNIYGTPLIFINDKAYVGPKPYRTYNIAIGNLFSL
ncbi:MAG: thioredoxin domain-containing protein [Candidatus Dojkabacteria bacterium]|nr:MAG: thioredoxin domain-containing protein [Candidatus Dojkabacteria bacterium]